MVTVGNLIQSGESGGTMLTTIVSLDPIYCLFDVDDSTSAQVKQLAEKQKESTSMSQPEVFLGLTGETSFPWRGTINLVDNQNDPATGTLKVRGIFPNPNHLLTPGKFVRVRVPLGEPHKALLVIDRAIDTDQGQKVIYVVDSNKVIDKRPVQLGRLHEGMREIVKGLRPGELVVVDGLQRVRGGLTVEPHRVDMPHVYRDTQRDPGRNHQNNTRFPIQSSRQTLTGDPHRARALFH